MSEEGLVCPGETEFQASASASPVNTKETCPNVMANTTLLLFSFEELWLGGAIGPRVQHSQSLVFEFDCLPDDIV